MAQRVARLQPHATSEPEREGAANARGAARAPASTKRNSRAGHRAVTGGATGLLVEGLVVLAAVAGWRAVRHLALALREPDHADSGVRLVRGIRALIVTVTSIVFALGIVYESRAMLLLAAVILGEELYETGVVLLALRRQRRDD